MNAMIHFPSQGGHLFAFLLEVGEVLESAPFHLFPFSALSLVPVITSLIPLQPNSADLMNHGDSLPSMTIPAHWAPDLEGGGLWEICGLS